MLEYFFAVGFKRLLYNSLLNRLTSPFLNSLIKSLIILSQNKNDIVKIIILYEYFYLNKLICLTNKFHIIDK